MQKIEACAICAWRQNCQKKFSLSGRSLHCPEFVRDISIESPLISGEGNSGEVTVGDHKRLEGEEK